MVNLMSKDIELPPEESGFPMFVRFVLSTGDTITIGGNSVTQIFFETMKKFPEHLSCKSIGFSAKSQEEAESRLKEFFALTKRFG